MIMKQKEFLIELNLEIILLQGSIQTIKEKYNIEINCKEGLDNLKELFNKKAIEYKE